MKILKLNNLTFRMASFSFVDLIDKGNLESDLIRGKFVYDFTELDYISKINTETSSMQIELGFALPFYGSRYRSVHVITEG